MKSTDLLQLVDNLQQVCRVPACVLFRIRVDYLFIILTNKGLKFFEELYILFVGGGGLKRLIWSYGTLLHLSSGNPSMSVT